VPDLDALAGSAPVVATGITTPVATKAAGSLDKDAFLQLLVAQLKYQNPMDPADPSQMMAQTAQFTMVESLQAISEAQADAGVWQRVVAGQGLIGKQVTGTSADGADLKGLVTGLAIDADGAQLTLSDGTSMAVDDVTSVAAAS
jgi:flagellar basal-body rod modification protein FlgD